MPTHSSVEFMARAEPELVVALYRAGLAVARGLERVLAPVGLPPVACSVLAALGVGEGLTVGEVSRVAYLDRRVADNALSQLVGRGLVERIRSRPEGRLHVVCRLTRDGHHVLAEIDRRVMVLDERLRQLMGDAPAREVVTAVSGVAALLHAEFNPLPRPRRGQG